MIYCMNGIEMGYLYFSPFEAFIDAITTHTISNTPRNISIGIPIIMKQSGNARIMYKSIEI